MWKNIVSIMIVLRLSILSSDICISHTHAAEQGQACRRFIVGSRAGAGHDWHTDPALDGADCRSEQSAAAVRRALFILHFCFVHLFRLWSLAPLSCGDVLVFGNYWTPLSVSIIAIVFSLLHLPHLHLLFPSSHLFPLLSFPFPTPTHPPLPIISAPVARSALPASCCSADRDSREAMSTAPISPHRCACVRVRSVCFQYDSVIDTEQMAKMKNAMLTEKQLGCRCFLFFTFIFSFHLILDEPK